MLTVILTSAAAIGAVAVPAALWLTLQAPAVQPVAATAGAATAAAVAPTAVPPEAGAVLRGRISGTVGQALARLRQEGGLDVRDRTWLDEGRPRLVDIDAGAGLDARAVLARMAEQAGLTITPGPAGQLLVGVTPLPAAVEQALERPVTFSAEDMPLRKYLGHLGRAAGLSATLPADLGDDALITLRVKDMKCRHVLDFTAKISGLGWTPGPRGVTMVVPGAGGIALLAVEPEGARLRRFLHLGPADFLRRALPEAQWENGPPSDLGLADGSDLLALPAGGPDGDLALALLRGLSRCSGGDPWDFVEGLHRERQHIIDSWRMQAMQEKDLGARRIEIDLQDAPFDQVVEALRAQSGINVVAHPALLVLDQGKRLTIRAAGIPLSQALDQLRTAGVTCEWKDSALYFLPAEDGKVAPAAEPQRERSLLSGTLQPSPLDLPHRPGPGGAG